MPNYVYSKFSDDLYHHGIKGQRWGVRRFQNKDGTLTSAGKKRNKNQESYSFTSKNGDKLTMTRDRSFVSRITKKPDKDLNYSVRLNNKKVGMYSMALKPDGEGNVTWLDISNKHQGKGYATAVVKQGEKIAKKYGIKKITAEVVGISPDMLHVTDKLKYKRVGEDRTKEALDVWGGYTLIEKEIR